MYAVILGCSLNERKEKSDPQRIGFSFAPKTHLFVIFKRTFSFCGLCEVKPRDKAQLEEMLRVNNIKIPTPKGYDLVYLDAMLRADYFGSSITTEQQLMKMIGDYMNDPDGYDGRLFAHYYADRLRMGWPILWEDVM